MHTRGSSSWARWAENEPAWLPLWEEHECLAPGLTSEVSEVDGLPVGVEQLDDGVVIILHSAADGGRFALNHGHVVSRQVLALHYRENIGTTWGEK